MQTEVVNAPPLIGHKSILGYIFPFKGQWKSSGLLIFFQKSNLNARNNICPWSINLNKKKRKAGKKHL